MRFAKAVLVVSCIVGVPFAAVGGFPSTETFLPAVGRVPGADGAQFYTTIWVTNLTGAPVTFTFEFLRVGQANPNPPSFVDTLSAGQTKTYENVVGDKLGLSSALGGARVTATGEVLVAERIYDQAPGADLGNTQGLFFAGVPKSFSISLGQSASIQGVNQGGAENFRYNFALVETGGGSPTVNVQLFDGDGHLLGQKAYAMQPYEQLQPNVTDLVEPVATTNARITATVTGGTGSVLLAGAQVANESQDSSGFEMSFRNQLLGGGGGAAGVTSLNGLTGAVTLAAGSNVTLNKSGNTLTINAAGGGGGGGGLALPFSGSVSTDNFAFTIQNSGSGLAIEGDASSTAIVGHIDNMIGTFHLPVAIQGQAGSHIGVYGGSVGGTGVLGESQAGPGVAGDSQSGAGLNGSSATGIGVFGKGATGVRGESASGTGVFGYATGSNGNGVYGSANGDAGVRGLSGGNDGVFGETTANGFSGVYGLTAASGYGMFGEADGTNQGAAVAGNAANGGKAAHFYGGDVYIDNNLHVTKQIFAGTKDFEIDDPLDPANKYLVHASIESSEMLNVYTGNATLDGHGVATIVLPAWMEAENADFRYQLTAVGSSQPGLYVAAEVRDHRFVVAGGAPGGRISWQISGVRRDPWAAAHPLVVEEPKPERERGFYLHPEAYGAPPGRQVNWAEEPGAMQRLADGAGSDAIAR